MSALERALNPVSSPTSSYTSRFHQKDNHSMRKKIPFESNSIGSSPVIATKEAKIPFMRMNTSTRRQNVNEYNIAKTPPPTEAFRVTIADRAAYFHLSPETPNIEPQLKPNQPHLKSEERKRWNAIHQQRLSIFALAIFFSSWDLNLVSTMSERKSRCCFCHVARRSAVSNIPEHEHSHKCICGTSHRRSSAGLVTAQAGF